MVWYLHLFWQAISGIDLNFNEVWKSNSITSVEAWKVISKALVGVTGFFPKLGMRFQSEVSNALQSLVRLLHRTQLEHVVSRFHYARTGAALTHNTFVPLPITDAPAASRFIRAPENLCYNCEAYADPAPASRSDGQTASKPGLPHDCY